MITNGLNEITTKSIITFNLILAVPGANTSVERPF